MIYEKNTIYITGIAKISSNDPISDMYDTFFIGIILDRNDGRIIDVTCNMVKDVTSDFIKSIMIGYNLMNDEENIIDEIRDRFHGIAQKAVIAALKDARNRYMMLKL
ncbi:MAG: hypothetical protein APF77_16895 [Clostridia bacterium BRH_c25]|nr:MAG: hypothetical protein APF77_16895 [Clostridia bacterium BRH_c25]